MRCLRPFPCWWHRSPPTPSNTSGPRASATSSSSPVRPCRAAASPSCRRPTTAGFKSRSRMAKTDSDVLRRAGRGTQRPPGHGRRQHLRRTTTFPGRGRLSIKRRWRGDVLRLRRDGCPRQGICRLLQGRHRPELTPVSRGWLYPAPWPRRPFSGLRLPPRLRRPVSYSRRPWSSRSAARPAPKPR